MTDKIACKDAAFYLFFSDALEGRPPDGGGIHTISNVSASNDGEPAAKRQGIHCRICREVLGHNYTTCATFTL